MPRHRLATEADHYRLPAPPPASIAPGSFQLCSPSLMAACTPEQLDSLRSLYQSAFESACEAARSRHPNDVLFALWN
jgi:hypothetical protein